MLCLPRGGGQEGLGSPRLYSTRALDVCAQARQLGGTQQGMRTWAAIQPLVDSRVEWLLTVSTAKGWTATVVDSVPHLSAAFRRCARGEAC